ncbi:hypothetical protein BC629DRAFT_403224 [Irpex lacteus]|nr:hypothetical protein BC629DRAFT_403224 [Irpex lacteus]
MSDRCDMAHAYIHEQETEKESLETIGDRVPATINMERLQRDANRKPRRPRSNYGGNSDGNSSTHTLKIQLQALPPSSGTDTAEAAQRVHTGTSRCHLPFASDNNEDSSSESDDDYYQPEAEVLTIATLLTALDHKYPALNFPQYGRPLAEHGIRYVRSAVEFDQAYLRNTIGMADGETGLFMEYAQRMMRKRKALREQSRKEARTWSVEV